MTKSWNAFFLGIALACAWTALVPAQAQKVQDLTSWTSWGNTLRFDRYSPANQIDTRNVSRLKPVWKYAVDQIGNWEITPIVAGGRMYAVDMQGAAFALMPENGRELWRFASHQRGKMRGVSYWPGDSSHGPRLIFAVADRIYALEAETGNPAQGFGGTQGYINIRDGFAEPNDHYRITSPPTVYRNLLITSPGTQEFGSKGPPGDIRAYDAVTGKLIWRFRTVPRPGEHNFGSWGRTGWKNRAGPSAWGMYSVDTEAGLVFVPTGNPADSYIGIDRPGDNLYANSIIALDAMTGAYRWHFQTVHHDLFDYDNSAPPALLDIVVNGKKVPALVEVTKQGLMFILNRRTGKPVFGVEERQVPPSTIPGEITSPTQPIPIKPPPLAQMGISRTDISTITPEATRYCRDQWDRLGLKDTPPFTPPGLSGPNLMLPANYGGAGGVWGGVTIDPRTGTIFTNIAKLASYNYIRKAKDPSDPLAVSGLKVENAYTKFLDQNGLPCIQPPWGEMVAINGNSGDIIWRRPLGSAEAYGALGADTGMVNVAGAMATAGGLLFIGATGLGNAVASQDQPLLRAYDSKTGSELWKFRLPAPAEASPMSFIGKDGRQYVVIASSGALGTQAALIAFALPRQGDAPVDLVPGALPKPAQAMTPGPGPEIRRVEDLPPGTARDDVANICTRCHALSTAISKRQTAAEWAQIIENMRGRGAVMDDALAGRVRDYLAVNFGTRQ